MSDQTHYETCWKDPRHHECALRRIAELEAQVAEWKGLAKMLRELVEGSIRIAELEARWIPVEERLPEDGKPVLCATDVGVEVLWLGEQPRFWLSEQGYAFDNRDPKTANVTHWMPLPEPPEAKP